MSKRRKKIDYFATVDIPTIGLLGMAAGFLMTGVTSAIVMPFTNAADGEFFALAEIWKWVACVFISALILGVAYLYWNFIPKTFGVVYPGMTAFGTIIGVMALFSGMMLAMCLYFAI